jgi:hypothetical protein
MATDWNKIGAIGTWFSGVMTPAAVVLALGLQWFHERRNQPRLSITLKPESGNYLSYVSPEFASAGDNPRGEKVSTQREELWLRVAVENSGGAVARDVEVRLRKTQRAGDKESESRESLWFKAASINSTSMNMLPRGLEQHFDIAFVVHKFAPSNELFFHLALVTPGLKPDDSWAAIKERMEKAERNKLVPGDAYELHIVALSSNADAVHHAFSIRLNKDAPTGAPMGTDLKSLLIVKQVEDIT